MSIIKIRHKGLRELFELGRTGKVERNLQANAPLILDHLDSIAGLKDCAGVKDFHPLKGKRAGVYSMHVSGNWCITFKWKDGSVEVLDLEDYH